MQISKSVINFINSQIGVDARQQLTVMVNDPIYNTPATYTPNQTLYSDNLLPFVDKHINYLSTHQNVDVQTYVANLRLMTRSRSLGAQTAMLH
jgi:hypothetical protein